MNLPKVIINDNYADYLSGKEVEATVVSERERIEKGMHVMGFHNSIAINTGVSVPREKQVHYIGVEGLITEIERNDHNQKPHVRIRKV